MKKSIAAFIVVIVVGVVGYFVFVGKSIAPMPDYAPKPSVPTVGKEICPKDIKNSIKSIRTVTLRSIQGTLTGVEIELTSTCAFPSRNELVVLGIGKQEFILSRYADNGYTRTIIFTLMGDEFAKVKTGDPVKIYYGRGGGELGGQKWEFGPLDKSMLDKGKSAIPNPAQQQLRGSQKIETRVGTLTLSYQNGTATLSGTLMRVTPCVDWQIVAAISMSFPTSAVQFRVSDKNRAATCIQVIGEPQFITASAAAVVEKTTYTVMFEDEVVYAGGLTLGYGAAQ